jgi:hypothetical protein
LDPLPSRGSGPKPATRYEIQDSDRFTLRADAHLITRRRGFRSAAAEGEFAVLNRNE